MRVILWRMPQTLAALLIDAIPPLLAVSSLSVNIAQFVYARSRRSAVEKQNAIRAPLAQVLASIDVGAAQPGAADWPRILERAQTLSSAIRQLDGALIGAKGAPLSVVLVVTRLEIALAALLRWQPALERLRAGRSSMPERDYRRWTERCAAEADLAELRHGVKVGIPALRAYMALLNA